MYTYIYIWERNANLSLQIIEATELLQNKLFPDDRNLILNMNLFCAICMWDWIKALQDNFQMLPFVKGRQQWIVLCESWCRANLLLNSTVLFFRCLMCNKFTFVCPVARMTFDLQTFSLTYCIAPILYA